MPSSRRFVVLFTILALSSKLGSQTPEVTKQGPTPPPEHTAAVPPFQPGGHTSSLCGGRPCTPVDSCTCGGPAYSTLRQSIFFFGGAFANESMKDASQIVNSSYDGNSVIGLGYQCYTWSSGHFHLGWEVGIACRLGGGDSVEFWGGPTIRYDGIVLADRWKITPSFTAGLSVVTETIGVERHREDYYGGDGTLLFYLAPEIAISSAVRPNVELFYRLHHRSGAGGLLGELREGYNANVIGLRVRY
jgi:hypothetical protein